MVLELKFMKRLSIMVNIILDFIIYTLGHYIFYIDGLMQERRNSIANGVELRLSCTNPSI